MRNYIIKYYYIRYSVEQQQRTRKKMEMPTFMYNLIPCKKREELIIKRNVRVIKEFLKKREQMKIAQKKDMAHLKQLRKDKSISASEYRRLEKTMVFGHEQKRIELIKTSMMKSIRIGNSSVSYIEKALDDDQQSVSIVKNNS